MCAFVRLTTTELLPGVVCRERERVLASHRGGSEAGVRGLFFFAVGRELAALTDNTDLRSRLGTRQRAAPAEGRVGGGGGPGADGGDGPGQAADGGGDVDDGVDSLRGSWWWW